MSLTVLPNLQGKTIAKAFEVDGDEVHYFALKFTDGSHIVAEVSGNYAGGYLELHEQWNRRFWVGDAANELLVALGIRTQEDLDAFLEEEQLKRELVESKRCLTEAELREKFPTLIAKGIVR